MHTSTTTRPAIPAERSAAKSRRTRKAPTSRQNLSRFDTGRHSDRGAVPFLAAAAPPAQNHVMRSMVLEAARQPLQLRDLAVPGPGPDQVLLRVSACAVCRTDLHIVDGELDQPKLPLVIGHQIVGRVVAAGERAERFQTGQRVGVPWLGWTDGDCRFCRQGLENLCERGRFTGYQIDGGY